MPSPLISLDRCGCGCTTSGPWIGGGQSPDCFQALHTTDYIDSSFVWSNVPDCSEYAGNQSINPPFANSRSIPWISSPDNWPSPSCNCQWGFFAEDFSINTRQGQAVEVYFASCSFWGVPSEVGQLCGFLIFWIRGPNTPSLIAWIGAKLVPFDGQLQHSVCDPRGQYSILPGYCWTGPDNITLAELSPPP